jgi:Tol biopolymer transport system component
VASSTVISPRPPQTMTRLSSFGTALLLSAVVSCGGDSTAPPTTGTLEINIVTTGADIDADGFLLGIDNGSPRGIGSNTILSLSLSPGTHTLAPSGLGLNCDITTAPLSADVSLGATTHVDVRAACKPYLSDAIIFTSEQFGLPEIMAMRPDGSRRERITTDQVAYSAPVVSPDGNSIAVAAYVGGAWNGIYLLNRFGKGRTQIVANSNGCGSPTWSPDGTKLAFVGLLPGPYGAYGRIFIVNRDGTGLRQVSPEVAATDYQFDSGVSWAPDGTRLVFSRNGVLNLINADGSGLISTGVSGAEPAWSPDGTQIAYGSISGGGDGLFVMDGTFTSRRLTTPIEADQMPRWSPTGTQLVFDRVESGVFQIYKIGADGSGVTKLSTVPQSDAFPTWTRTF